MSGHPRNEQLTVDRGRETRQYDEAAVRLGRECIDGALELSGLAYGIGGDLHP
jgi:hypothetical protein